MPEITPTDLQQLAHDFKEVTGEDIDMCQDCDGYKESDCCGAYIDPDILICSDCKEHSSIRCDTCDYKTQ